MEAARFGDVTGLILDGGRARRLGGRHKPSLEVEGTTIAARTVELFAALFALFAVLAWIGSR